MRKLKQNNILTAEIKKRKVKEFYLHQVLEWGKPKRERERDRENFLRSTVNGNVK